MINISPAEVEFLASGALIKAARVAIALAETTNTLVVAKGFYDCQSGDPYLNIERRIAETKQQPQPANGPESVDRS